jgi:hypothetical protein
MEQHVSPPSDLRHKQPITINMTSFVKCSNTFSDGSVVNAILYSNCKVLSQVRPPRQIAKASSVILHEERESSQSPDDRTNGISMVLP